MSIDAYRQLIASKAIQFQPRGLSKVPPLNSAMFPYQEACTAFALETGCAGLFLSTGLGKSLCSLDWGRVIVEHTNKPVIMLAPLAVSKQHEREAAKFGIDAKAIREPSEINGARVYITNYERLAKFADVECEAVILDESGILKSFTGSTSRALRKRFEMTSYRLAASATPAPNDHMEIGQQCEFLGVMRSPEMLSRWFIADQSEMGRYRIKAAARRAFWDWVASWARCVTLPSDLGYDDASHVLPELVETIHTVAVDMTIGAGADKYGQTMLFRAPDMSATSVHREKRLTSKDRANKCAEIIAQKRDEPWIVWCETDYDADAVMPLLPDAVEVRGNMKPEAKEEALVAFSEGQIRQIVTKPSIAGFGLNWQHCANMVHNGLSFSFEAYHQAVRRCWRFGQKRPVHSHIVIAETEAPILATVLKKAERNDAMRDAMRLAMRRAHKGARVLDDYNPTTNVQLPDWLRAA